jgi:hypothetical protein
VIAAWVLADAHARGAARKGASAVGRAGASRTASGHCYALIFKGVGLTIDRAARPSREALTKASVRYLPASASNGK